MLAVRARILASSYARRRAPTASPFWWSPSQPSTAVRAMASSSSSPPSIAVKPVADAEQLRASGTPYLDVRTPGEFAAGHPPGAINVDWLGSVGPEDFVAKVKQVLPDAKSIVVGCKSGRRSASACSALAASGYAAGGSLVDVEGGFDAWSAAGLPVEK